MSATEEALSGLSTWPMSTWTGASRFPWLAGSSDLPGMFVLLEGSVPHPSKDAASDKVFYDCLGQKFQIKPESAKKRPLLPFYHSKNSGRSF